MSLKVKVVSRVLLTDESRQEVRFYGQVKSRKMISFDQLCERISRNRSVTKGDVQLVLNGFLGAMKDHLMLGKSVKLDGIGCFRLTAGSRGVDDEADFHASVIREPNLTFRPGRKLKKMLKETGFMMEPKLKKVPAPECPLPHVDD